MNVEARMTNWSLQVWSFIINSPFRFRPSDLVVRICTEVVMTTMARTSQKNWAHVDLNKVPNMRVPAPGPKSRELHARCTKYFKGLSGQVKLFPVSFESGSGCVLRD